MMLEIKTCDIRQASEQYIVHQCCCTAVRPHGLAAILAKRFPDAWHYAQRRAVSPTKNLAIFVWPIRDGKITSLFPRADHTRQSCRSHSLLSVWSRRNRKIETHVAGLSVHDWLRTGWWRLADVPQNAGRVCSKNA